MVKISVDFIFTLISLLEEALMSQKLSNILKISSTDFHI